MYTLHVEDFPLDIARLLKVKAAQEGRPMRELVIEILQKEMME